MTLANENERCSMALPGYAALLLVACGLTFLSWMAAYFRDALLGEKKSSWHILHRLQLLFS
jgi:hypothetical protein